MIRELKHHWYEIFHHLGFSHEQLAQCKKKHPLDSELCLMEMITQWTRGTPSWESLVSILRYQLLENEVANKMEKAYCVQEDSATTTNSEFCHADSDKQIASPLAHACGIVKDCVTTKSKSVLYS